MSDEQKNQVRQTFSKSKESYVTSSTHSNRSDLDQITEWLQPQQTWTVLDIATGGGHVAKELSRSAGTVFATDLTKDMLQNTADHLKQNMNIHYVVADAEDLPFLDNQFDAVTCRIAPHHFPHPDQFISEVARVLKNDGLFLMIDNVAPADDGLDQFYNTFEKMRDPSHARALKISEWEHLIRHHDLTITKQTVRRKTLPYADWLTRTVSNPLTQNAVKEFLLRANEKEEHYFSIIKKGDTIETFTIDEWVVLAKK
ncbi:methyltransferase domain-containing protein [Halobacillus locisalis]|uniref:Methyltransferase domain-containing protein n=1 Tax=Halobacillus locisalis TaxID=220753 RepID=A0A838CXI0_9BACI|nr:class I SAM-dependent methyltransferase [Halobacillus locisalis]MBA2176638.1 methyltransferase domain-containing protein [Halobacillus locisalis]